MTPTPPGPLSRRRFLQVVAVQGAALAAGLHASGASPAPLHPIRWQGIALGTEASLQLYSDAPDEARALLAACRTEILRLEGIFSLYDGHSALGRLNRHGALAEPPRELVELITFAHRCSELTDGAFDVSIHPVCEVLAAQGPTVDERALRDARALVDYRQIECTGSELRLRRPGMRLTLNGIAQGYITDRIAELLRRHGCSRVLVEIGEKRALGRHPGGRPWRIGIESPFDRSDIVDIVELADDRALATSAGHGGRYGNGRHHLLDARTGSSRHEFASVSVLAPDATTADALSTCLAVLPPDAATRLLAHFPRAEARLVDAAGRLRGLQPAA